MKKILDTLSEEIRKLEKETEFLDELDSIISERLKENERQSTLNEIKTALTVLELNAEKRVTQELFIYAESQEAKIILDAKQRYRFRLLTLQEIKLKTMYNFDEGIKHLWNQTNRLTSYVEFKDRSEKLLKKIEAGELDEYIRNSSSKCVPIFRLW